jgi:hypothetical protein
MQGRADDKVEVLKRGVLGRRYREQAGGSVEDTAGGALVLVEPCEPESTKLMAAESNVPSVARWMRVLPVSTMPAVEARMLVVPSMAIEIRHEEHHDAPQKANVQVTSWSMPQYPDAGEVEVTGV